MTHPVHSGGCQCGAIRYRITAKLEGAGLCHCRMCQKASGNLALPLVRVPNIALQWTRGKPAEYRSSPIVARGFCNQCGTPLYMLEDGDLAYEITIGSLDNPSECPPDHAVGLESKIPWFDELGSLPGITTGDDRTPQDLAKLATNQHPDTDTGKWPA
ncbi:MAG: GFA family protein [Anderseniella sp.]